MYSKDLKMTLPQELLCLNATDYIILAVVVVSTLISLLRGFFKELISLLIWIIGFWVALKFHVVFANKLTPYINNISFRLIVSFAVLFVSILILGAIFNYILSFIIRKTGLSGIDRLLGMFFGCARGLLLITVVILLISTTSFVQDEWWKKSIFIPYFHPLVTWLHSFLPEKLINIASAITNTIK